MFSRTAGNQPGRFFGSHNEWDPLIEVIIGHARGACVPSLGIDQAAIEKREPSSHASSNLQANNFSDKVIDETEEDLENFISQLVNLGIRVRRPETVDHSAIFSTPNWFTNGFYSYCPRDSLLVIGDRIIETPMALRSRFLEPFAYKSALMEYFSRGANWISAPKPRLLDDMYSTIPESLALNNHEPIFDAANVIRAGRDLFYLVSDTGNELGATWLQRTLGPDYVVHPCRNLYSGVHIDSTISLLRPGLVLLNAERVNPENLPAPLRKWDRIICEEIVDTGFTGDRPLSTPWVGMNIFMINPELAAVDRSQTHLIKRLEAHRIEVLPVRLRHARTLGGGFHCVTLDTERSGMLENYF
ncbi:MAG: inosamine-phosphate amidinotransferase 1 [Rhodocyclaceae bacterium]|nr:inosamine-phosphate amidinotransferase 1 [Rhodocyclaceae bacterium]